MKRLSEFKDEAGIELVGKLMLPISRIVRNRGVFEARAAAKAEGRPLPMMELASAILSNAQAETIEILALLNEEDPSDYHFNAATVFGDVMQLFADPDFQALFGLQSKTTASSGSASESTEAPEASGAFSDTVEPESAKKQKKKSSGST